MLPSDSESNGCPTKVEKCHHLSYYISYENFTHSTDLHLVFLEGTHSLNSTLHFERMNSVLLTGLGQWTQGPHWSVMQSTTIIKCQDQHSIGLYLSSIQFVYISDITVVGCGINVALNISTLQLERLSIQNNSNSGLFYKSIGNGSQSIIKQVSFHRNCLHTTKHKCSHVALINIAYSDVTHKISKSNFSCGVFPMYAAMNVYVNSSDYYSYYNISLTNCLFLQNKATHSGGLRIAPIDEVFNVYVSINRTKFINNSADFAGCNNCDESFLQFDYPIGAFSVVISGSIVISNSLVEGNKGGGGYIECRPSNGGVFHITDSKFNRNIGTGLEINIKDSLNRVYLVNVLVSFHVPPVINIFHSLHWEYGALVFHTYPSGVQAFLTNVTIFGNNMTGLLSLGCAVTFTGLASTISSNIAPLNGGGIWMSRDANIVGGPVLLINNTALKYGGAIYSESNTIPTQMIESIRFQMKFCSIVALVNTTFESNRAGLAGNDVFGGQFFECWIPLGPDFNTLLSANAYTFNLIYNCSYSALHILEQMRKPLSSHVSSDPFGVCFCSNHTIDCYNRSIARHLFPGQVVKFPLVTVGFCGGVSPGVLVTRSEGLNITILDSSQQTHPTCQLFAYQFKMKHNETGKFIVERGGSTYQLDGSSVIVNITFLECPLGLTVISGVCLCNDVANTIVGIQCNVSWMPYPIKKSGSNWLYADGDNCTVAHNYCPFDYCIISLVSVSLDEPDIQCTHNRSGILCGQCIEGYSLMLGSNRCGYCNNMYLSLLTVFIVAGVVLVLFLLFCNLTVATGSINGLLFYANVIKLNEVVLFPKGKTVPVLSQFISWLNLDLGIETCFFKSFNDYLKTWLQFAFPLYIWILIGSIIIVCHYNGRISRLFGNNTVPVLATLILMSFTKLLRTITNALMMTTIDCKGTHPIVWKVWSIDGNIEYLSNEHIPLFIVSLLVLFIGLVYTVLILSTQWLQRYDGKCSKLVQQCVSHMKPIIDAYSGPYKDKYRFWTGLLLLVRIVVIPVFSYTSGIVPQLNNFIVMIVGFITLLVTTKGIYRSNLINILECIYLFNMTMLSIMSALFTQLMWDISLYISSVSVGLSFIIFVIIILSHIGRLLNKRYQLFSCHWIQRIRSISLSEDVQHLNDTCSSDNEDQYSPSIAIQRRESLIFDFNL